MAARGIGVLAWAVVLSTACGSTPEPASPDVNTEVEAGPRDVPVTDTVEDVSTGPVPVDVGPDTAIIDSTEGHADSSDTSLAHDSYWPHGWHPLPPGDLPPVPQAPLDWGPGFVDLSQPIDDAPPFTPYAGTDEELPGATTVVFGDIDGDGQTEVVVSAAPWSIAPHPLPVTSVAYRPDPDTGHLVKVANAQFPVGHILAIADFDDDGQDDVMTMGPSGIHWGGGGGTFTGLDGAGATFVLGWHAANLADIDDDGLLDLIAQPSDCCTIKCPELVAVLATGRRHYTARPEVLSTVNHGSVCASLWAPVGHTRMLMSFAATGNCGGVTRPFYQPMGLDEDGWPVMEAVEAVGETPTLELALSAPMGGSVGDVDGDGDMDLTITTNPHHAMYRADEDWPLVDVTTWTGIGDYGVILPAAPLGEHSYMIPWGAAFLDLDRDGREDIVYSHGADPNPGGGKAPIEVGPQHVTAHWNGGDWRFADVTSQVGLMGEGEWRGLTVGDLDADGDPDLGVGGLGELPRVYRNDIVSAGHGFSLRLNGTTSNPLGLGAMVRVRPLLSDPEQVYVMGHIGNPYGVSQALVFVGLGEVETAEHVEITWPSGYVQVLSGLEAGQMHIIEEPPTITVSPWSRRMPGTSPEPAIVDVVARKPDGSTWPEAVVSLEIVAGIGSFAGPPERLGDGWRWTIPAPGLEGTTVVEASIEGSPLRVRPRFFWD